MRILVYLSFIIALISIVFINFKVIINSIIRYQSNIINITRHYSELPLEDVKFRIPIIYDGELLFPDYNESVNIQTHGRLETLENCLVDIEFDIEKGSLQSYRKGFYDDHVMFLNLRLLDNNAIYVNQQEPYCELYFSEETVHSNDLPYFTTQLLLDHVFIDEFHHFYPGYFLKVPIDDASGNITGNSFTIESISSRDNSLFKNLLTGEKMKVPITIYFVASDRYELDVDDIIRTHLRPSLDNLNDLFIFEFSYQYLQSVNNNTYKTKEEIAGVPYELTDLPLVQEIIKFPKTNENDIKIIYYPYEQGGPLIHSKTINDQNVYSSNGNTFVPLESLGSIYFCHLPNPKEGDYLIKDFAWSISRTILDTLGIPSSQLVLPVRIDSLKRIMIVELLTKYGNLLAKIHEQLVNSNEIYDLEVISLVSKSLEKRANLLDLALNGHYTEALHLAFEIVDLLALA